MMTYIYVKGSWRKDACYLECWTRGSGTMEGMQQYERLQSIPSHLMGGTGRTCETTFAQSLCGFGESAPDLIVEMMSMAFGEWSIRTRVSNKAFCCGWFCRWRSRSCPGFDTSRQAHRRCDYIRDCGCKSRNRPRLQGGILLNTAMEEWL